MKETKKIKISELRQLIRSVIKEEFGGTPTPIQTLIDNGTVEFKRALNKEYKTEQTPSKKIVPGYGVLRFLKDASNIAFNSNSVDVEKGTIVAGQFIEGVFDRTGLNNGKLYSPVKPVNYNPNPQEPGYKSPDQIKSEENISKKYIKTIIPRQTAKV